MTAPLFPYLPGLTFPIDRSVGQWDTVKQVSVSGKETRFAARTQARYRYTLAISGLDSSGQFPTLAPYSKQALEALFNNTLGGAGIFYFWDAEDNSVVGQPFGTGDGTTTQFQLYRSTSAGWNDAIFAPVLTSAPILVHGAGGIVYAPNNLITYSSDLTNASWALTAATLSAGVSDPFGGSSAFTLTATAINGFIVHALAGSSSVPTLLFSAWVRRRTGVGPVFLDVGDGVWRQVPITSSWQRLSISVANTTWENCAFVVGTSGDAIDIYGPQPEANASGAPSVYIATSANPYFGAPLIYKAGALQSAGTYSVSSAGVVSFNSPPASGQALTWTGSYWWPCNFDDDTLEVSEMMGGLWEAKSLKFTTRVY